MTAPSDLPSQDDILKLYTTDGRVWAQGYASSMGYALRVRDAMLAIESVSQLPLADIEAVVLEHRGNKLYFAEKMLERAKAGFNPLAVE